MAKKKKDTAEEINELVDDIDSTDQFFDDLMQDYCGYRPYGHGVETNFDIYSPSPRPECRSLIPETLRYYSRYTRNPITPNRLLGALTVAIWPTSDPATATEARVARTTAIRFLLDVTPLDLAQLQSVLATIAERAVHQPGAMDKLISLYQEARKKNALLPPINSPPPKTAKGPPPKTTKTTTQPPKTSPSDTPRTACRACDGRGYRQTVDKENTMREARKTPCSRCGGNGFEPGPPKGKGRGRGFYSRQEQTEEEEDINRKTDNFLKKHGFDKWGQR